MSAITFDQCSICLLELKDPVVEVHPQEYAHVFHEKCINRWTKSNSSCPLCRREIEVLPVSKFVSYARKLIKANRLLSLERLINMKILRTRELQQIMDFTAIKGNYAMCKMIIEKTRSINCGQSLVLAAKNDHLLVMGEILNGAHIPTSYKQQALVEAAKRGFAGVCEFLCYHDRDHSTRGKALIAAVQYRQFNVVEFLLRQNLISLEDKQQAHRLAEEGGLQEVIHLLQRFS